MSTHEHVSLPSGWSIQLNANGTSTIEAPTTAEHLGGGVTINWKVRKFSLGYGCRLPDGKSGYGGRGWREAIVADAVKALDAGLLRFRKNT